MIIKINGSPVYSLDMLQIIPVIQDEEKKKSLSILTIGLLGTAFSTMLMPKLAYAISPLIAPNSIHAMKYVTLSTAAPASSGIMRILDAYVGIASGLCVAVIMFAGTAWMLGHRTKAIESLIGASAGLLIIMHANEYVDWLKHM